MPKKDPPLGIRMEVNGIPYDQFISFTVNRNIEDFSGSFDCVTSNTQYKTYPIKVGSQIKIIINNEPIITGYVDSISPKISASSHDVSIRGRDVTCDIIDSTLSAGDVELPTPTTITDIINKTQSSFGLAFTVVDKVGTKPYATDDLIACKAGETGFDFIDKNARKRQVFVSTNGRGEIVVTRAEPIDTGIKLLNVVDGADNNIIESNAVVDNSKRYGKYIALSQSNLETLNLTPEADLGEATYISSGAIIDEEIRSSRIYNFIAENPSDGGSTVERAQWEANIRKARSLNYTATIQGIANPSTGKPYELNGLVYVRDDELGFDTFLLVKEITHNYSVDNGETTQFGLTYKNAYTLEINEPKKDKKSSKIANQYQSLIDDVLKEQEANNVQ